MKTIALFAAFLCSLSVLSQSEKFKQIDSIINSKVQPDHPGVAVGVVKDGKIIYEYYRGLSNLQHQIPFSEKTRSNIASTAKQFTALMILDLALKNKLQLEDDIRKYLPSLYQHVKDEIKIRHLINHTSGIRDYVELLALEGPVWWQRFGLDNDDIMELLEKQEDLGFKPGSKFGYSNSNYNVLTKIIEKVSGEKFTKYSKAFFKRLGMNETSFVERYMRVIPNRANPYSDWGRGEWWEVPTVTKTSGEGFLFTTLKDQLIFEQTVQNANHNNNVLFIKSQQPVPNSEIKTYGFGLKLQDRLDRTSVHHDGVTYGFNSQTIRFPKENVTVFILSNNGNIRTDLMADQVATLFLSEVKNEDNYDSRFYESSNLTKEEILGQYRSPGGYLTRIVEEDGKLYFRQKKSLRIELIPEGNHKYHFSYNPKEKVAFYENEMVLFEPSGETSVFKSITDGPASFADIQGFVGTYYNGELEIGFELKLSAKNNLLFAFSNDDETSSVQIFNRNELLAGNNYVIKIQRDRFDRVTDVLFTYGRAKNIRFIKKTNLKFQPKIPTENGSINVSTIGSRNGNSSTILLTKNYPNGNEIWYKRFGGNSYDKASSIIDTEDGYLIIGSTSSYGVGNYDMFVIKTDKNGKKLWQNTYGKVDNDYGYTAEKVDGGYIIKGTIQQCNSRDVLNRKCTTNIWFVTIDEDGNEVSSNILEEFSK